MKYPLDLVLWEIFVSFSAMLYLCSRMFQVLPYFHFVRPPGLQNEAGCDVVLGAFVTSFLLSVLVLPPRQYCQIDWRIDFLTVLRGLLHTLSC